MVEVLPNLWLGNKKDSFNQEFIDKMDLIIKCSREDPILKCSAEKIRVKIDITKDERQYKENNLKFLKYIKKIVPHIHKKLLKRKNILVCCNSGEQQSANILLCYLIKYGKIDVNKAHDILKSNYPTIFSPINHFEHTLKQFIISNN
tara:strand:- start:42 stop:482 length:441 start_codon:yes stop_codon:yes gene_type:complete